MKNNILKFIVVCIFGTVFASTKENEKGICVYIKPLYQVLKENPSIECLKCFGPVSYDFPPFLELTYPNKGIFDECFILSIPQGRVQGFSGNILINNSVIKEMIWAQDINSLRDLVIVPDEKVFKIDGRVVVLAQQAGHSYSHCIHEILGRLALLEMYNIEYDYIYVSYLKPFLQELFDLWGIPAEKVIYPVENNVGIQAKNLIVPSLVINTNVGFIHVGLHDHPMTSLYVREKLLDAALKLNIDISQFSKRVFISRNDAPQRKIINQDEIFQYLEKKDFVSYELSKMSVAEQIILFHNADIILGEHGTGLTNIIFCKKNALIFELFQKLIDSSFWWISNLVGLRYIPINTLGQDTSWAADWRSHGNKYSEAWAAKTVVPLDKIQEVIEKYLN